MKPGWLEPPRVLCAVPCDKTGLLLVGEVSVCCYVRRGNAVPKGCRKFCGFI